MTIQESRPAADSAQVGVNSPVPERELSEWAASRTIYLRIAAALIKQITEESWHSWHPVPENSVLARVWDCSPETALRAKQVLRARGVLVYEKRAYYVA